MSMSKSLLAVLGTCAVLLVLLIVSVVHNLAKSSNESSAAATATALANEHEMSKLFAEFDLDLEPLGPLDCRNRTVPTVKMVYDVTNILTNYTDPRFPHGIAVPTLDNNKQYWFMYMLFAARKSFVQLRAQYELANTVLCYGLGADEDEDENAPLTSGRTRRMFNLLYTYAGFELVQLNNAIKQVYVYQLRLAEEIGKQLHFDASARLNFSLKVNGLIYLIRHAYYSVENRRLSFKAWQVAEVFDRVWEPEVVPMRTLIKQFELMYRVHREQMREQGEFLRGMQGRFDLLSLIVPDESSFLYPIVVSFAGLCIALLCILVAVLCKRIQHLKQIVEEFRARELELLPKPSNTEPTAAAAAAAAV